MGEVDAIVVPYQSVLKLTGSNDRYVFVVDRDRSGANDAQSADGGQARRVAVTLGQRFDDRIEIIPVETDAMKAGDQLVVTGQARLVDGDKLEIVGN